MNEKEYKAKISADNDGYLRGFSDSPLIVDVATNCADALATYLQRDIEIIRDWNYGRGIPEALVSSLLNFHLPYGTREGITFFDGKTVRYGLKYEPTPELEERIRKFEELSETLGRYSCRIVDHPFTVRDADEKHEIIGFGISPYLDRSYDGNNKETLTEISNMLKSLLDCMSPECMKLYDIAILPKTYSLYCPGFSITILFFKKGIRPM